MDRDRNSGTDGLRRRALLTSAAVGAASLGGCLRRFRSVRDRESPEQVSLEIATLPGDEDRVATRIGRQLDQHLTDVGVDTELQLLPQDELRRRVLINQEFDLFVSLYSNVRDPDFLRPLLHSAFTNESGWQNPFGFTHLDIDELLLEQKGEEGGSRASMVSDLQYQIARQQPFAVVAIPDDIHAARTDRFTGWERFELSSPLSLIALAHREAGEERLRVISTDDRVTRNLNPIAIEFRNRGTVTGLLYDSLGRQYHGQIRPWAAKDWEFEHGGDETIVTVTLRSDLQWHDGTRLSADDVEFTIDFLSDTSRGGFEVSVPAPRFRGRTSLIDDTTVLGTRRIQLRFPQTSPTVAKQALTIPILPRQEWEDKTRPAEIARFEASSTVTEALVWSNDSPIGSGPLAFKTSADGEQLVLERYDDHFLGRDNLELPSEASDLFENWPPYEELSLRIVRSNDAAAQLLESDEADAVISSLDPTVVPTIGRTSDVDLLVDTARSFYMVGFNTDRPPLNNPHFRRFVARLLDKEHVVDEILDGYGIPAASPLDRTDWLASGLRWRGSDPEVPFLGTGGNLDVESARDVLREAGFEYNDDGELVGQ